MDMAEGRDKMSEASRGAVERGLTTDRHTWDEAIEPMDFPYVAAAFRGEAGHTELQLYYALPTGLITREAQTDTLSIEVGVALHDSSWTPIVNQVNVLRLPARNDLTAASVNAIRFAVPPDSYHVALHGRALKTRLIGGYTFEKRLPDFSKPELALSDLLLAYDIAPTTDVEPSSRSDLKIVVNPFHRFALDRPVHVYFEIYHLTFGADDLTSYSVEYMLVPEKSGAKLLGLFRRGDKPSLTLKMSRHGETTSPIEYTEIDMSRVEPGRYVFQVTVTNEQTEKSVTHMVPLELYER